MLEGSGRRLGLGSVTSLKVTEGGGVPAGWKLFHRSGDRLPVEEEVRLGHQVHRRRPFPGALSESTAASQDVRSCIRACEGHVSGPPTAFLSLMSSFLSADTHGWHLSCTWHLNRPSGCLLHLFHRALGHWGKPSALLDTGTVHRVLALS